MFKLFNPSGLDPTLLIGLLDGLNEEAGEPWNGRNSVSSSFYLIQRTITYLLLQQN